MSTIVENNNGMVNFSQVWPEYVYTDIIPENPPSLDVGIKSTGVNDNNSIYTVYTFNKQTDNGTYPYLMYVSHLQLKKEYRQENIWVLEYEGQEEFLRRVIFPGKTTDRTYTPIFSSQGYQIPFTTVNPYFDLKDCRISTKTNFKELYFSGWLYVGKNLEDFIQINSLPFDDQLWLVKHIETGNKAKFEVTQEKTYVLPPDLSLRLPPTQDEERLAIKEFNALQQQGDTILTVDSMNTLLYHAGELDGGEYW